MVIERPMYSPYEWWSISDAYGTSCGGKGKTDIKKNPTESQGIFVDEHCSLEFMDIQRLFQCLVLGRQNWATEKTNNIIWTNDATRRSYFQPMLMMGRIGFSHIQWVTDCSSGFRGGQNALR